MLHLGHLHFLSHFLVAFPASWNLKLTVKKVSSHYFQRIFIVVQSATPNTLNCLLWESTVQEFTSVCHIQTVFGAFKDESSPWKIFTNSLSMRWVFTCGHRTRDEWGLDPVRQHL